MENKDPYQSVAAVIEDARQNVRSSVNSAMVLCYWHIGRLIVEDEQQGKQRAVYGTAAMKELSLKLLKRYGKGFDRTNLRRMRQFYSLFPKCAAVRRELSWTHYKHLMKVEDEKAWLWYQGEAIKENWSTRALERQMDSYIRIFENKFKESDDNPTIGLILCADKNETMVKYSMLADNEQLFASKYKLYLPSEEELQKELTREIALLEKEE